MTSDEFRIIREDIAAAKLDLQMDIQGVNNRLDTLNSRTGKNEQAIAVLNDRTDAPKRFPRVSAGAIAAGVAGILEGIHWYVTGGK